MNTWVRIVHICRAMNVLMLNGCCPTHFWADDEQARWEQAGAKVTRHDLAGEKVAFCQGCFECWVKTPGVCKTGEGWKLRARRLGTTTPLEANPYQK